MVEYAFPTRLVEEIKARWSAAPVPTKTALPDDRTLQRLLEACYHASLRTIELRPIRCALALVSTEKIPKDSLLLFEHPVALTDSELVRLAPVTDLRRTLIGCHFVDATLRIWGLFEHGRVWTEFLRGDPGPSPRDEVKVPPDYLTITIEAPGALNVACGKAGLVRIRGGRIVQPQENPLRQKDKPLGLFFQQLVEEIQFSDAYREQLENIRGGAEVLFDAYTTAVASILDRIRLERHGGSIVIARVALDKALAYRTYTVAAHVPLADEVVSYCEALGRLSEAPTSPSHHADELEKYRAEAAVRVARQRLARGVSRVSLLSAVDGAVLLDSKLQIEGFGVRFPVLLPPGTSIVDALTGIEYACDEWGLRHQSVFSVCQRCEEAVGVIVSKDGGVKAVKAVEKRLLYWDGVLD